MLGFLVAVSIIAAGAPASTTEPASTWSTLSNGQWMSYRTAGIESDELPCCYDYQGGRAMLRPCRLERGVTGVSVDPSPISISTELRIFVRRGEDGLDRAVAVGANCPVDTDGHQVTALGWIPAATSVGFLDRELDESKSKKTNRDGLFALAHHRGPAATRALIRRSARDRSLRRDAFFWLAHRRGRPGFEAVQAALTGDESTRLKRHLVFCLSQSPMPDAAPALRRTARRSADDALRSEALFWLSQRGDRQTETIALTVIDTAASTRVKKKAVFALSQLPADRAFVALKRLVRSDRPRPVRREALFWLAQQDDDRAIAELESILSRPRKANGR